MVEELVFLRIIPVDVKVSDGEDLRDFVKRRLLGVVAGVGDVLEVLILGRPFGFRVLEASPEEGRIGEGSEFLFEGLEPVRERAKHLRDIHLYWSKRPLARARAEVSQLEGARALQGLALGTVIHLTASDTKLLYQCPAFGAVLSFHIGTHRWLIGALSSVDVREFFLPP